MGRTVPTFVEQVRNLAEEWSKYRRCLRFEDRDHFDRMLRSVRYYTPSAMFQCSNDPREPVVVSILLDFQKRIAALEGKLKISGEVDVPPEQIPLRQPSE